MKRILVTGGAGFLGSHLCGRLIKDVHDILCVDNFFTGSKANRPDTTERVFAEIAKTKPPKLFVVWDGARASKIY